MNTKRKSSYLVGAFSAFSLAPVSDLVRLPTLKVMTASDFRAKVAHRVSSTTGMVNGAQSKNRTRKAAAR